MLPCVLLACRLSPTVAGLCAVGAAVLVVLLTGVPIDWPSLPDYLGITAEVLFILLNGMILARLMQISGAMRSIGNWVSSATPGIGAGTAFVVFGVVPFVECVTGFGIGVTVGVPILITLGHKPAKAALLGLLGLCAVPWGALAPGTAVASSLTGFDFTTLGVMSGWYNSVVLVVVALTVACGTGFVRAALPTFASAGFLWVAKADAAQERRAALQTRLDEAIAQYTAGQLNLDTLTKVEQTLRPQIAAAERELIPPITDARVKALVTAPDLRAAWAELSLAEQRAIIKAGFDIRIQQTQNRGQNAFEPGRVLMEPRTR